MQPHRKRIWDEAIGRLPASRAPSSPSSREIIEAPRWTGYEVTLDVLPEMVVGGYVLLPKDLKQSEWRIDIVACHVGSGPPGVVVDRSH